MDPKRWHRLSSIFHEALEHSPHERAQFVDGACADDVSLREEVTSLLAHHDQAAGVIDERTEHVGAALAPEAWAGVGAESLVGRTLNQYVVTRQIGAGGMGEVYLADDTRLGRLVAIKSVGRAFTQDPERRERLRQEARAAAALSHPSIATVYALEEVEGTLYLVSEYVAGRTLREELADGPLEPTVLVQTGLEIARALDVAHAHGVIHRDLKPENVIRTHEGHVKVLDFGVAHLRRPDSGAVARLTAPGVILGTPGYMPPEQLRGAEVDFRADQFAFGVLLYELAAGVHPFHGSDIVSTIARVLESTPSPVATLNPNCPTALEPIIVRCLQKDPAQRFAATRELADTLDTVAHSVGASSSPRHRVAAAVSPAGEASTRPSGLWWWQFHQAVVGTLAYLMLIPLWTIRGAAPAPWGSVLFFTAVAAVGVAATLRFHLWFVSRFNPTELRPQRRLVFRWVRTADWLFVTLLMAGAAPAASDHAATATLLVAVAVGNWLAFMVIEPATTRAAFGSADVDR